MKHRRFNAINEMIEKYEISAFKHDPTLKELDHVDFIAFIYSLDTGRFDISGFNNKSFLRYIMTSGKSDSTNWAMDIANNLQYSKNDFLKIKVKI